MYRRRPQRVSILLPGERPGRRGFLKLGLFGAAFLAVGGSGYLATRRTRVRLPAGGPLSVFSPEEATVLMAVAERLVPERAGFPRPAAVKLAEKMDRVAAMADPATQLELRRLVRLFESALGGLVFDRQPQLFTEASPAHQDLRLRAWAESRIALRRTGHLAMKRLVYASYYGSPETYAAVGYPGPPLRPSAERPASRPTPPAPSPSPPGEGAAARPAGPEPSPRPPRRRGVAKPFEAQPVDQSPPLISPSVNDDG
ncbi:MAG TPA: hypothetical protein VMG32_09790 [Anaeromyxobacteraceae bacterium]|nr:hypothetical protein [Anaeromyxobacteraceae bacterium]